MSASRKRSSTVSPTRTGASKRPASSSSRIATARGGTFSATDLSTRERRQSFVQPRGEHGVAGGTEVRVGRLEKHVLAPRGRGSNDVGRVEHGDSDPASDVRDLRGEMARLAGVLHPLTHRQHDDGERDAARAHLIAGDAKDALEMLELLRF